MKKFIKASKDIDILDRFEISIQAEDVGYKMTIDNDLNMKLKLKASNEKQYMPTIEVETIEEDGVYYFSPSLTFPDLNQADMDYYDSIHYWLEKWEKVGKFISRLVSMHYDPREWEE